METDPTPKPSSSGSPTDFRKALEVALADWPHRRIVEDAIRRLEP